MTYKLYVQLLIISVLFISSNIKSQVLCTDYPDVRVSPDELKENSIAVSPQDPNFLLTANGQGSIEAFISSNQGITWSSNLLTFNDLYDPTVQISVDFGTTRLYISCLSDPSRNVYVKISTNNGADWQTVTISSGLFADQPFLWHDNVTSKMYCSFGVGAPPTQIYTSYSTDLGYTWSTPLLVSSGSTWLSGSVIKTDTQGNVYLTWRISTPEQFDIWNQIDFRKSTNGGVSWIKPDVFPIAIFGASHLPPNNGSGGGQSAMAINPDGDIFISWANYITLGPDYPYEISCMKSTNQGETWSFLNFTQPAYPSINTYPSIECDPGTGVLSCVYYSEDHGAYSTWISTSTNSGATWCAYKISNGKWSFTDRHGDYISIAAGGGWIYPVWNDTRTGINNVFISPPISSGDYQSKVTGNESTNIITSNVFYLHQNYPNPFNPVTVIEYSVPKPGYVSLILYDILGNKIKTLDEGNKQAGNYNVSFDASGYATGVYYYTLVAGDFKETKKMMLIK